MAIVVQSTSTTTNSSGSSTIVLTKPAGLALDDLILVHLAYLNIATVSNVPTGFVLATNKANQQTAIAVYYKIADATDVAASDFTFTLNSTIENAGGIARITGHDLTTPIYTTNTATITNDSSPSFADTITPLADSLIVMANGGSAVTSISGIASYAIVTSNPSWTEAWELKPATNNVMSLAYGTRSAATATGNSSLVCSTPGSETEDWNSILFSISLQTTPNVTTQAVSSIASTTATANGTIVVTGSSNVDKRGVVYGTSSLPNPGNVAAASSGYTSSVEEAAGPYSAGAFTESLTSLTSSTTYYVRAYAHNSSGYVYGDEVSFITSHAANSPVTLITNPILGEVTVWRNRILYGIDQPNTTSASNDDVGGVWMMGSAEPQLPLINSLYFMTSSTSAAPYRPWGVRMGGLYADQTQTVKAGYQDTQATATSAQYHIATLDTIYTGTNSSYAYYITLPINCDTDAKKLFYSIRPTLSGKSSSTMGVAIYYRTDVDATSLYDTTTLNQWTLLRTITTDETKLTTPIRKIARNIQFKFVFIPASGFSPQLLDYTIVYESLDQYR